MKTFGNPSIIVQIDLKTFQNLSNLNKIVEIPEKPLKILPTIVQIDQMKRSRTQNLWKLDSTPKNRIIIPLEKTKKW